MTETKARCALCRPLRRKVSRTLSEPSRLYSFFDLGVEYSEQLRHHGEIALCREHAIDLGLYCTHHQQSHKKTTNGEHECLTCNSIFNSVLNALEGKEQHLRTLLFMIRSLRGVAALLGHSLPRSALLLLLVRNAAHEAGEEPEAIVGKMVKDRNINPLLLDYSLRR